MASSWGARLYQMSKTDSASVGSNYSSRESCGDVLPYYEAELTRSGWSRMKEYAIRDPAGISRVYGKGQYSAVIGCTDGVVLNRYWLYLDWSGPMSGVRGLLIFLGLVTILCLATALGQRWISRHRVT